MDIIDKFYLVCELFDDDLYLVAIEIKKNGAKGRPSKVLYNISNLFLAKYETYIDRIYKAYHEPTSAT